MNLIISFRRNNTPAVPEVLCAAPTFSSPSCYPSCWHESVGLTVQDASASIWHLLDELPVNPTLPDCAAFGGVCLPLPQLCSSL